MLYKITNNKATVKPQTALTPLLRPSRNNNAKALQIPSCRTLARKESFFPRTIREWNTLPTNVVEAGSAEDFKAKLEC